MAQSWHKVGSVLLMTSEREYAIMVLSKSGRSHKRKAVFRVYLALKRLFCLQILRKEEPKMKKMQTKVGKLKAGYWTLVSAVSAMMISVMPVNIASI